MIQQKVKKTKRPALMLIFSTVTQKSQDQNDIYISILCEEKYWNFEQYFELFKLVKGCVCYIFANLYCMSKKSTCETRKFKCFDVIKYSGMKHETYFTE